MRLRLRRATALARIERVLAAADEIVAARWDYLVEPVGLALFGSCLDPARVTVGDVDLMFAERWLPEIRGQQLRYCAELFARDRRRYTRAGEETSWPTQKMLRRLRGRSGYVSLHATWRDGPLSCPVRVLWRLGEGRLAVPVNQNSTEFAAWCEAARGTLRAPPAAAVGASG